MKTLISIGHQSVEIKWYLSPILFCFELVLQNAWQLHETYDEKAMDFSGVLSTCGTPLTGDTWSSSRTWPKRKNFSEA